MAVKYELKYDDIVGVEHHFELFDDNYTGSPIEVYGRITLDYGQVKENLEAIRGQGLRVDLEADVNLTFEELFEENEKTFLCTYKRDSQILFRGWLNPEGFFEDYVNDKWQVSFDCIDGLGYLKELSFVDNNGFNVVGIKSQLEILSIALRRTGIEENINVAINVFYDTLADTESILENVFVDCSRYVKDDGGTISSCEEVIKDILEPYGAVLVSNKGEWTIYKPNELFNDSNITFFKYDYLGTSLGSDTIDFDFTIGSQLDEFYPHHANANQSFTNIPSVGAYRINYKFGDTRPLTNNKDIYNDDGVVDFWTFGGNGFYYDEPSSGNNGVTIRSASTQQSVNINDAVLLSDGALIESTSNLTLRTTIKLFPFSNPNVAEASSLDYAIYVSDIDINNPSATVYRYRKFDNTWILLSSVSGTSGAVSSSTNQITTDIEILNVPINGLIYLAVYVDSQVFLTPGTLYLSELFLFFAEEQGQNSKGLEYTFQRTKKPSARILNTKKVLSGDDPLNAYLGTLYKSDRVTPTENWYRKENVYESTTNYYLKPNVFAPNYGGSTNFLYYFPNVDLTGATTITDEKGKTRSVISLNYYVDTTIGDLFIPGGVPFTGTRIESNNFVETNVIEDDLVSFEKTFTVLVNGEANKPILEIMGSETMRMTAKTMRIFSGDVFGYFDYLSRVNIDKRAGKYGVTKYSYDTYNNVISMEIKQMYGTALTDLSIETVIETDNVVEPTIRG
jgi:hypothetical protein